MTMRVVSPLRRATGLLARLAWAVRRVIGVPDYERYVTLASISHPGSALLSREAFARDALSRRYDRPGSRCC